FPSLSPLPLTPPLSGINHRAVVVGCLPQLPLVWPAIKQEGPAPQSIGRIHQTRSGQSFFLREKWRKQSPVMPANRGADGRLHPQNSPLFSLWAKGAFFLSLGAPVPCRWLGYSAC